MNKRLTTYTGKKLDPSNITPQDIDIQDIAAGLSAMPRFAGQTRKIFTVASHSIILSEIVPPELAKCALLHDASEAFLGDVITPVKTLVPEYQALESSVMSAVLKHFGLAEEELLAIKPYDKQIAEVERIVLFENTLLCNTTKLMHRIEKELTLTRREIMWNFLDRYAQVC